MASNQLSKNIARCRKQIGMTQEDLGQALFVSDITDEETKLAGILLEFILHDELLEFITGIDNDLLRIVIVQYIFGKSLAKTAGTTCDQNGFII